MHEGRTEGERFWLILVAWGERYGAGYINEIAKTALGLSPRCDRVLLITDAERDGVDDKVGQVLFPEGFRHPDLFAEGYPAKLALFTCPGAPDGMRCVYVDLDTVVLGDLGRIAADLREPNEILMLRPGALLGFNAFSRLLNRLSGGRRFVTGNSSVVAFTAGRGRELAERYLQLRASGSDMSEKHMRIDDVFISWFAAQTLRAISPRQAVMFRREFLSRVDGVSRIKGKLPWVRRRRDNLVAITLNGEEYKPKKLLELSDGDPILDRKGRKGYWSAADMGPIRDRIADFCRRLSERDTIQ